MAGPIGAVPLERITRIGWEVERARELMAKRQGILLTSVAPGSPAFEARCRSRLKSFSNCSE